MSSQHSYLFVYGTLREGLSRIAGPVADDMEWSGSASVKGVLYDLGEYPGAVNDEKSDGRIKGEIFRMKNPAEAFRILDKYEGYDPDDISHSLFVRSKALVYEDDDKTLEAWVYWYNFPVDGMPEISGRDYLEHLKQKGKEYKAYGTLQYEPDVKGLETEIE